MLRRRCRGILITLLQCQTLIKILGSSSDNNSPSCKILNMASDESANITLGVGTRIRIKGLVQFTQHNEKMAVVISPADPQTGRYGVVLEHGDEIRIKPGNIVKLDRGAEGPLAYLTRAFAQYIAPDNDLEWEMWGFDFSWQQAKRVMDVVKSNSKAAIEYAASVKRNKSIKQHLARFGLDNVIRHCGSHGGSRSRIPGIGIIDILAQLEAAGASDAATLRMLFGNEQLVAGMLEEAHAIRGFLLSSAQGRDFLEQHPDDDYDDDDERDIDGGYDGDEFDYVDITSTYLAQIEEKMDACHQKALRREEQRAAEVYQLLLAVVLLVFSSLDPQERKELERIIISLQYNGNGHVAAVYARQGHSFMCVHSAFLSFWPCRSAHLFWL
jgi:hypothetical protein